MIETTKCKGCNRDVLIDCSCICGYKSALDHQEAGNHYKNMTIQPVVFCQKNKLNWCEANVIKYICRHKDKGGIEDLKKVKHYVDLLIEIEYKK